MHRAKFWAGIILILLALTSALGISLIPGLSFAGPLLVIIAILGGYLLVGSSGLSHGWMLYSGVVLILIALLPAIGIVLVPALVFAGPLLVIVAALGGYLIAKPHHGHGL